MVNESRLGEPAGKGSPPREPKKGHADEAQAWFRSGFSREFAVLVLASPPDGAVDDLGGLERTRLGGQVGAVAAAGARVPLRFSRLASVIGGPGQRPPAETFVMQPDEPFVLRAPVGIDQEMVLPAPADIDEAMVFPLKTSGLPQAMPLPPLAPRPTVPGRQPIPIPNGSTSPPGAPLSPMPGAASLSGTRSTRCRPATTRPGGTF